MEYQNYIIDALELIIYLDVPDDELFHVIPEQASLLSGLPITE